MDQEPLKHASEQPTVYNFDQHSPLTSTYSSYIRPDVKKFVKLFIINHYSLDRLMNNNTLTFFTIYKYLNFSLTCKHDQQHNKLANIPLRVIYFSLRAKLAEVEYHQCVSKITLAITHKAPSELAIAVSELTGQ